MLGLVCGVVFGTVEIRGNVVGKEQSNGKQKLAGLKQQQAVLKARIQQMEAREKTVAKKQDLRRRVLVGTFVLQAALRDGTATELYQRMDSFLVRNSDRMLFGLPALATNNQKAKQTKEAAQ